MLQQIGTQAAHEAIEGVGRKEYGRFEIYLHGVANELIEEAVENGCSHIIFEDLRHIRENISQGDVATHLGVPTVVPIRRIQSGGTRR